MKLYMPLTIICNSFQRYVILDSNETGDYVLASGDLFQRYVILDSNETKLKSATVPIKFQRYVILDSNETSMIVS